MRGRAVLTMFWSSAASIIASKAPAITVRSCLAGAVFVPVGGKPRGLN